MSHKFIPYPCDYKNTASVRRAHRAGNIFVIILCAFIVLLLAAGTFFALTNDGQAWKNAKALCERIYLTPDGIGIRKAQPEAEGDRNLSDPKPAVDPEQNSAVPSGLGSIPDVIDEVSPSVVGIVNYQKARKKQTMSSLREPAPASFTTRRATSLPTITSSKARRNSKFR